MRAVIPLLLAVVLPSVPAIAAETAWQQVAPDTRIRLIGAGEATADGRMLVALDIDMPETVKTYWRVPGESGIPLQLDLSGSRGIAGHEVVWPMPLRETDNGYLDHVYYGPTVLPIALEVEGGAPYLMLEALLGICSDICVPVRARFELPLGDPQPDAQNRLRIAQAVAEAPIPWDGAGDGPIEAVAVDPATAELVVRLNAGIELASLIADAGDPAILFGVPNGEHADGLVRLPLLAGHGRNLLDARTIRFTFATESGPYHVVHAPVALDELLADDR